MRKTRKLSHKSPVCIVNRIRDGKLVNKLKEIFLSEIVQTFFFTNQNFKKIYLFH